MKKVLVLIVLLKAFTIQAQIGVTPQAKWGVFSFSPTGNQDPTYNYFGVGPALELGYNEGYFDLGAFIQYLPGRRSSVKIGHEDAGLNFYGAYLNFQIQQEIFIGFKGGQGLYHLLNPKPDDIFEVRGLWQGYGAGFSIGSIHKISKNNLTKLSLEIGHMLLKKIQKKPGDDLSSKVLQCLQFSISHIFLIK